MCHMRILFYRRVHEDQGALERISKAWCLLFQVEGGSAAH